jgi:hypothetical protein
MSWLVYIRRFPFPILIATIMICSNAHLIHGNPIPVPKIVHERGGTLKLETARITIGSKSLQSEADILESILSDRHINSKPSGTPITLNIEPLPLPQIQSSYRNQIERQAYRLVVEPQGILIVGKSPQGVFYGLQTLDQLVDDESRVPFIEITDWPDLAVRMIMVDPARQNENMEYYRRLIQFAARYKINAILCHLTDDQTSCLKHEDYPELMHPHAWTTVEIRELVAFAEKYHIELVPEIESFGHSRMFTRRSDFRDFLHQTKTRRTTHGWTGTDASGYTNVLCPASSKALEYLNKMYDRAIMGFKSPWLHIGCDEVDITECERCQTAFPGISPSAWILKHVLQCRNLVVNRGKTVALWGDMLLHYPEVVDDLPTTNTIIFDWYYKPDVTGKSSVFFKEKGFEVIASPALVCYPHMIMPDKHNLENISRFTRIAREHDLMGVNTTIWIPTRYMSDVLWPGIAYAAAHAWSGSIWDEAAFYKGFLADFFRSNEGEAFHSIWSELSGIMWHCYEFNTSCWIDENSLDKARKLATERREEISKYVAQLEKIEQDLARIGKSIRRNSKDWIALERSVKILHYTMEHLLASLHVKNGSDTNMKLVEELDKGCIQAISWIEEDWNRNRYPDDPNKNGLYLTDQHLLFRFKQMHILHESMLRKSNPQTRGINGQ